MLQVRILKLVALCLGIKLIIFIAAFSIVKNQNREPVVCSWDCGYYFSIAERGYEQSQGHGNLAFFPAYPLLVKPFKQIPAALGLAPDARESFGRMGAFISWILFGVAIYLFALFCIECGLKLWWLAPLLWTLDRFTLWAVVPYTESLFCIAIFSFLVWAKKSALGASLTKLNPPQWSLFMAALIGGAATGIRMVGGACVAALGLSYFKYFLRKPWLGGLCFLAGIWGVAAYFGWIHFQFGDWTLSLKTTATWDRHFEFAGFFKSAWHLLKMGYFPTLLILTFSFWFMIRPPKQLQFSRLDRLLCFFLAFIPMASSIPISLTRYLSILFLGYMAWAYFITHTENRWLRFALIALCVPEFFFQIHLLAKFFRVEVFAWAG